MIREMDDVVLLLWVMSGRSKEVMVLKYQKNTSKKIRRRIQIKQKGSELP